MEGEILIHADAVQTVVGYLNDQYDDLGEPATVHSRIPKHRPDTFTTVVRTGGINQTLVSDGAQLTIECWGEDEKDAHDLAQLTRGLLHAMRGSVIDGVTVYGINEFSGPSVLPDPISNQDRVTFTVQVGTRSHLLAPSGS